MIAHASGLDLGVGRFPRPRRGVGVLTMPKAGLDTTRRVESVSEVLSGTGVLRLLLLGVAVEGIIDCCYVATGVDVAHRVISATRELFSKDEGVGF